MDLEGITLRETSCARGHMVCDSTHVRHPEWAKFLEAVEPWLPTGAVRRMNFTG